MDVEEDESTNCVLCGQNTDDPSRFGQKLHVDNTTAHYYCLQLSTNIKRSDNDTNGLFGYLSEDIATEVKRASKTQCVYCKSHGASISCCQERCRKSFHLPCAIENNCDFDLNDENQSFCNMHSSSHTTDEAETIEPRTIKRRIRKPWSYVETFGSKEDAMEALKNERCWSMLYKNTSSAGTRVTYRCNLVKLQGKQCDAGVYLLYDSRSSKVHWFRSETEHTHDSLKNAKHLISSQFTSAEEAAIIKMYEIGVRPKGIAISMVRKGFREPSNKALISFLQKLRNLKKKKKKHANLTEFHSVASSSRDLSTSTRSKQPKQEFISEENEDFPYDSSSRLSTTDNESANNDYFDDSNPVDKYGAESLQENPDQLLEPLPKKRKTNDFSSVSISVANSSTERPALNSNSVGSTSASMHKQNTDMKNISNADEKWWQAQYGFYLKLNRKQQFKMKKMISDLQLEFEYENLEDAEQEPIANRSEQNVRTNTGADDPLEVNTPWW